MDTITITLKRFSELKQAEAELRALESNGVDNWEGYSEAMASLYGDEEDEGDDD